MSLTSLYTGISGIDVSGTALSVIGDNIANMNTVGFKTSRVSFGDVLSSTLTSGTSSSQVGRGVLLSGVNSIFTQGAFETTSNALDMAIDGDGFFIVKDSTGTYYTRAGDFKLDKDGYLVNTDGLMVRGFRYTAQGTPTGVIDDINVSALSSSTQATQNMAVSCNIDSRSSIIDTNTIGFAAGDTINAGEAVDPAPPSPASPTYAADVAAQSDYFQTVSVYDSTGTPRQVDVHFIKTGADTWNWYGLVPAAYSASGADEVQATGTVTFDPVSGAAATGVVGTGQYDFAGGAAANQIISLDFANLAQGGAYGTAASQAGYGFDINDASNTSQFSSAVTVYDSLGNSRVITVYFTKTLETPTGNQWQWNAVVDSTDSASGVDEVQASGTMVFDNTGGLVSANTATGSYDFGGGAAQGQAITLQFSNFTQYAAQSETIFQSQDGFPAGSLQSLSISQDGVISGIFSNGQIKPISKLALAKFTAPTQLTKFGRNLYAESFDSGQAIIGSAGQAGLGRVLSNSLELSNVDLAREFVNMISAQRGFQANSRVISTTDALLQELVNLVR